MDYTTTYQSPIGTLTLASDGKNLTGLWMKGQKYHGATLPKTTTVKDDLPVFNEGKRWLASYFKGEKPPLTQLPLAPEGSEFRKAVWQILLAIPYGQLTTYGDIAKELARQKGKKSMSSQAVGGAVGHNPISIIIPCHRVVGAGGSLTGYAGGLNTKITLLSLEGVNTSLLSIPTKGTAL